MAELVAGFTRALQPDLVVETGTYRGGTAAAIGQALRKNRHGQLITIEADPGLVRVARARVRRLPVTVLHGDSLAVLPKALTGRIVQLCWLDSSPHIRGRELAMLAPFLDGGAVIGVHDTRPGRPPARALELLQHGLNVLTLRTPRGVSFAQVRE